MTRGQGIAIHREGCPNIQHAVGSEPDRIQRVDWAPDPEEKHSVPLRIETMDRPGLMADVMGVFSGQKINIEACNVRTRPGESALWDLTIDVTAAPELDQAMRSIRAIPDVLDVSRPGPAERPARQTRPGRRTRPPAEKARFTRKNT